MGDIYYTAELSNTLTGLCVSFSPPSTAMTLGPSQAEAEGLLEDRKGGDMHTPLSVTSMCTYTLRV